jgi:hypothetical protein
MCRSRVESIGERSSFAEVRDAELETDAFYQTGNLDDNREEQKAISEIHVLNEAADQPAWRSLMKYCWR